jgi:hypothetical protein
MATKKEAAAKKATPKATPKKAAEPVVSQEELLALGEEMNTLLFPGEEVDFSAMSAEEITAQIKADAINIDGKDQFSDDSKATLAAIGIEIEWAAPAAAKKDKDAGKKAAAAKKDAPAKKEKATGEKAKRQPPEIKKNAFGHRVGTMTDIIDQCLEKGTTADACADKILAAFPNKTKEAALAKFKANVAAFTKDTGKDVEHNEKKGTYKIV